MRAPRRTGALQTVSVAHCHAPCFPPDYEKHACRLHEADAAAAAALLPRAAHALAPLLGADHEGVRLAAKDTLGRIIAACLDEPAVRAATAARAGRDQGQGARAGVAPAESLVAAVAGALGAQHRSAWTAALPGAPALTGHRPAVLRCSSCIAAPALIM
jgi:hypothetical protein